MKKNPPVLAVTGIIIEEGLTTEKLCDIQEILFKAVNEGIKNNINDISHINFEENQTYINLDPTENNCFRCENCGRWTTNHEKPNEIQGLLIGREFEEMLICSECEIWKHDPEYGWSNKK